MANANLTISAMQAAVNMLDDTPQGVSRWLEYATDIVHSVHRGSEDWDFVKVINLREGTLAVGGTLSGTIGADISDSLVYGLLARSTETGDQVVVEIGGATAQTTVDGHIVNFDINTQNTGMIALSIAASDGTIPQYGSVLYPDGVRITYASQELWIGASDNEGANISADGIVEAYVLLKIIAR